MVCIFFQLFKEKVEESSEVVNDDDDDDDSEDPYWSPPTSEVELYAVFQNKKFKMIQRTEVTYVRVWMCVGLRNDIHRVYMMHIILQVWARV